MYLLPPGWTFRDVLAMDAELLASEGIEPPGYLIPEIEAASPESAGPDTGKPPISATSSVCSSQYGAA